MREITKNSHLQVIKLLCIQFREFWTVLEKHYKRSARATGRIFIISDCVLSTISIVATHLEENWLC